MKNLLTHCKHIEMVLRRNARKWTIELGDDYISYVLVDALIYIDPDTLNTSHQTIKSDFDPINILSNDDVTSIEHPDDLDKLLSPLPSKK
jgi:hypothetical protein